MVAAPAVVGLTAPSIRKKPKTATTPSTMTQNASRNVRVDALRRSACGRWRCIRSFLRCQGRFVRIVSSGGAPAQGAFPLDSRSEAAPLACADHPRVAPFDVAALQPRVDHPQHRERKHREAEPGHLARLERAEHEEESEDAQHAERRDPEQVAAEIDGAQETLKHQTPSRKDSC